MIQGPLSGKKELQSVGIFFLSEYERFEQGGDSLKEKKIIIPFTTDEDLHI